MLLFRQKVLFLLVSVLFVSSVYASVEDAEIMSLMEDDMDSTLLVVSSIHSTISKSLYTGGSNLMHIARLHAVLFSPLRGFPLDVSPGVDVEEYPVISETLDAWLEVLKNY